MAAEFVIGAPIFLLMGFSLHLDPRPAIGAAALIVGCWLLATSATGGSLAASRWIVLAIFYGLPTLLIIFLCWQSVHLWQMRWLARADQSALIGLHSSRFFKARPFSMSLMVWVYRALFWQTLILLPILWLGGHERRCWVLVTGAVVATAITIAIYPLAPADAAFVHNGVSTRSLPTERRYSLDYQPRRSVDQSRCAGHSQRALKGIVTFPASTPPRPS